MSGRDARKVSWPDFSGGPQVPVQVNQKEDLLERGFQLAYFIFPSRSQAVRILSGAVNKLKAQRGRESRRVYWRDKYLKRAITRITREEGDMLRSYELGVNAYVVKPVEFSQFMDSVKQLGAFWALVNEPPVGSIPLS